MSPEDDGAVGRWEGIVKSILKNFCVSSSTVDLRENEVAISLSKCQHLLVVKMSVKSYPELSGAQSTPTYNL